MSRMIRSIPLPILISFLGILLLLSCFLGLRLGYLPLTNSDVLDVLGMHVFSTEHALRPGIADAVWDLRLPRIILSLCVGMGLSLSGLLMQAMFRNPMADPYIMGISSGASLGAACAVFLGVGVTFGAASIGIGAFVGAMVLSILLVFATGRMGQGDTSALLIFGAALAAVCGGITSVLIFSGANSSGMDVTLYWLMGNVAFAKLGPSMVLLVIVISFVLFFATQTRILNLMLEGEETAVPLGRQLLPFMRLYLLLNAILVGSIVMNAGLIGFVGLLVPHFCRMVMGADHRRLLPVSVLVGGMISVWADSIGRILIPGVDIPLGVSLALLGAPAFVVMLVRQSYRFGEDRL